MRKQDTEVLVVGAGPVGLLTTLLLAEAGIQAQIIDLGKGTATRSYACALHPASIQLLARLGLADALMHAGRRVSRAAFYQGETRQAELSFESLPGDFPFVLVVPQSALEGLLE
jgi:2-polyprenyl-6-methoxyphenol hydroxylase-like FAD-dependent oxidoreductase